MKLVAKFQRAEYRAQPAQLFRRLWRILSLTSRRHQAVITLPWQLPIAVNPRDVIGSSIVALNTLDLPVTETIWRLLDERAVCADIGANIGYMTSVMAARLTSGGTIHSFEPLASTADVLEKNVAQWRPKVCADIILHRKAVSDCARSALLYFPSSFAKNQGTASFTPPPVASAVQPAVPVDCVRLDDVLGHLPQIDLIKVDVEGHELAVFHGAEKLLREGRLRDIVFEEHDRAGGLAAEFLQAHGYEIFRVARSRVAPQLVPPRQPLPDELDPATYLATRDPTRAHRRFAPPGWTVFRGIRKQSSS